MQVANSSAPKLIIGSVRRLPALCAGLVLAVVLSSTNAFATIDNTATATGTYAAATTTSNASTVNVSIAGKNQSMLVTKTANPTSNLKAGDVVTYTYTVKNTGNVTLNNISLTDVHNAAGPAPLPGAETLLTDVPPIGDSTDATLANGVWSNLAPGDTIIFTATYTVKQSDVDTLQ